MALVAPGPDCDITECLNGALNLLNVDALLQEYVRRPKYKPRRPFRKIVSDRRPIWSVRVSCRSNESFVSLTQFSKWLGTVPCGLRDRQRYGCQIT